MADTYDGEPTEADDQFIQFQQWFRLAAARTEDWREEAVENYDFAAGHQWTEDDMERLREAMRPCVTFNRTDPVIDAVAGMEVNSRHEVTFKPRTTDDTGLNEALSQGAKFFRDECDAEDEESDAFRDLLIAGMGWTDTRLDYLDDPDGLPKVLRTDPLEMYWDTNAKKKNLSDARWIAHVASMSLEAAMEKFPDADPGELNARWADRVKNAQDSRDYPNTDYRDGTVEKSEKRTVTIVEFQWWEPESFWRVADPQTGELMSLEVDQYNKVKKAFGDLKAVKQQRKCFYRAFLGTKVLEKEKMGKTLTDPQEIAQNMGKDFIAQDSFTFKAMTGKRDRNNAIWYGLVRAMKDPQRWSNKFFSTALHGMMTSGKGILAERDAFDKPEQAETDYAKPDAIVWMRPGAVAGQKVMPKPAGTFPSQLGDLMQFAITAIPQVTGVSVELMGTADRDQAASLEYQRRQAGTTILATMFDALRRYRKEQGRLLLFYIKNYLSDGRLIRIVGDEGAKYVPLMNQPGAIKYDVIVDESASSPNQKEATWAILQSMLPVLGKMGIAPEIWVQILKASPLPASLTDKIGEIIQTQQQAQAQQGPPPDPKMVEAQGKLQLAQQQQQFDQQAQQMEMQANMQLAAQKQQSDERIAVMKAQADAAIKAQGQAGMAQLEQAKTQAEIENTQANTVKTLVEAGVKQQEASVNQMLAETDQQAAQQSIQNSKQESDAKVQKLKQPPPKPKGK